MAQQLQITFPFLCNFVFTFSYLSFYIQLVFHARPVVSKFCVSRVHLLYIHSLVFYTHIIGHPQNLFLESVIPIKSVPPHEIVRFSLLREIPHDVSVFNRKFSLKPAQAFILGSPFTATVNVPLSFFLARFHVFLFCSLLLHFCGVGPPKLC